MYSVLTPHRRFITPWRYHNDEGDTSTCVIDNFHLTVQRNGESFTWYARPVGLQNNGRDVHGQLLPLITQGRTPRMYEAHDEAEDWANDN